MDDFIRTSRKFKQLGPIKTENDFYEFSGIEDEELPSYSPRSIYHSILS